MLGLFRSDPYLDESFGTFNRRRGYWRGSLELPPHGNLMLLLSGSRKAPDAAGLSAASRLPADYQACRAEIETALFEHYQPALAALEEDGPGAWAERVEPLPQIANASGVWPFVYPQYALIEAKGHIEIALRVAWDEEHCLGALIRNSSLYELNSSIRSLEYIGSPD